MGSSIIDLTPGSIIYIEQDENYSSGRISPFSNEYAKKRHEFLRKRRENVESRVKGPLAMGGICLRRK